MNQNSNLQKLQQALSPAQSILVTMPQSLNLDKVAASLALYLSLKKTGKAVTVVCPQSIKVEFSQLVGVDKVTDKIGNRNLTVSFDYVKDSIEKVSYNIEGSKFNILIQPKTGYPPLDAKKVSYSYSGTDSELIFIIGTQRFEDLGRLYENERSLFSEKQVVNIDYNPKNTGFGEINIFNPQASSYSEIVAIILKTINLPCDGDIATNLLLGLQSATNNFQSPNVSADTFEVAAYCLRAGAKWIGEKKPLEEEKKKIISSPDWLSPKIYKGKTRV